MVQRNKEIFEYCQSIARKYNLVTNFGKFMDPVVDKILVLGAFIAFVQMNLVH